MQLKRNTFIAPLLLVIQGILFVLFIRNNGESRIILGVFWVFSLVTILLDSETGESPQIAMVRGKIKSIGRWKFYGVGLLIILLTLFLPPAVIISMLLLIYTIAFFCATFSLAKGAMAFSRRS